MRVLAAIGVLAILTAIAGGIFFFGGFYNVAATSGESSLERWTLPLIRAASIERRATEKPPFSLDDAEIIQAGARAYAMRGCVRCHGAPGAEWDKFSEGLRPDPPDLKEVAKTASASEIFWVAKNGIRMTGMPGFGLINVGDKELWSIAAFVKQLPNVTPEQFKAWSAPANQ